MLKLCNILRFSFPAKLMIPRYNIIWDGEWINFGGCPGTRNQSALLLIYISYHNFHLSCLCAITFDKNLKASVSKMTTEHLIMLPSGNYKRACNHQMIVFFWFCSWRLPPPPFLTPQHVHPLLWEYFKVVVPVMAKAKLCPLHTLVPHTTNLQVPSPMSLH